MPKHPGKKVSPSKGSSKGKMSVGALSSAHQKLQKENSGAGKVGGKAGPARSYSPPAGAQN